MKIIHCADLHADLKNVSELGQGKRDIKRNQAIINFARIVDYANDNEVECILLCGDIFDSLNVRKGTVSAFCDIITSHPNIKFFYIWGNHDMRFVPFSDENKPENFIYFDETFSKYDIGEDITIAGSSTTRFKDDNWYDSIKFDEDRFNILMMHQNLNRDGAYLCGVYTDKLANLNVDYLALGHVHGRSEGKIGKRGMWRYSGSVEGVNFNDSIEVGTKSGVYVLDIHNKKLKSEFLPISKYDYHTIEVNISDIPCTNKNLYEKIDDITKGVSQDAIVKIVLVGRHKEEENIDSTLLKAQFESRFFFFDIVDNTRPLYDLEKYKLEKLSLKGEFLRMVDVDNSLSEDDKLLIERTGVEALKGDDLTI